MDIVDLLPDDLDGFLLDNYIASFREGNFDFIVDGIAKNSEGNFVEGEIATHLKQEKAFEILTDNYHEQFLYGGAAGGAKSWTGVCWIVFSSLCYPNTKWFIARNELKDLKESVMETFKKVCRQYGITDYKFNAVDMYIKFPNGSHINLIEVKYKPSDPMYEDVGSTEYTGGWIEEIGEVHEMAVDVLSTRIGRHMNSDYRLKKKLFMTCNPKQNWAKTSFYNKHHNGSLYEDNKRVYDNGLKPTIKIYLDCLVTENPFIEQDYIDGLRAKSLTNKSLYERLFKGNWDYEDNPYQLADQESIEEVFENDHVVEGFSYLTVDVARYGADKAVIIAWKGWVVKELITFDISSTQDIVGAITTFRQKYRIPKSRCIADSDGVGGGVVDIAGIKSFRNNGKPIGVNKDTPNYRNIQVQCLYLLAEKINEGGLYIGEDALNKVKDPNKVKDRIKVELAQIQSKPNTRDATKLDCKSKSDISRDIGGSPDYRDAIFMRVWFDLKPRRRSMVSSVPRNNF